VGILSRPFLKRAEREYNLRSLDNLAKDFAECLRALQVDLFADLSYIYSSQMDGDAAKTLAAQVANFLKGGDVEEIARVSDEPLRSRIMAMLPHVRQRAAEYMQSDRQTREIVVATLRMTTFLNFGEYGIAWLQSPAKMRIERLLVEYGPEFPEEITPAAYIRLFASYHEVKRSAWARRSS
jgi:hypothetical protein